MKTTTYRSVDLTRTEEQDNIARGRLARLMQEPPISAREQAAFRKAVAR